MIFAPVHLYVAWSLIPDLTPEPILQAFGGVIMVVSTVLIPYGTLASQFVSHQALVDRLVWAGSLTMGWFSSVLVLTLVRETVLWVPGVRPWAHESALAVLAVSVAVTVVGFFNARRVARVVHVDVPLANLPPALDGFTIAQITDIHVGSTIKRDYVQGIVERVNELNADIVAVTGDVVDGKVSRLSGDTAPLAQLRARHGAYVVTGNHEYYSGADDWMEEFRRLGLQTLMNEHRVIDHDGANIVVAGINDFSAARVNPAHESDPAAAIAGSPDGAPKVLLAHQPRSADAALEAGFDLQLSGHTHGGQFWPWNHFVRMQQPYTAGLHRLGALWIYTSRGTGYWGPPKRFGVPSEITLIRLTSQLASRLIPEA
ncbi:MAG: metallophosphoesterase [Rhodospirillaceae bacterium]|nr:metallophosphoesterase [Rhodospirillaceae bacterium]